MQLRKLFTEDSAVSPVIGVILMVAITVILAAVIAAFVLGLGESDEVGPQVSFSYNFDEGDTAGESELRISHQSGDRFTASSVEIVGDAGDQGTPFDSRDTTWHGLAGISADERISAGDRVTLDELDTDFDIDLVWTSSDGESSNIIGSRSGPDA